jgi:Bacterial Ig domain
LLNDATIEDTMAPFVSIVSPAANVVQGGTLAKVTALASDKSGVARIVFSVDGISQQTNTLAPCQFLWNVPAPGGVSYSIAATAYDNFGNAAASTIQVVSLPTNLPASPTIALSFSNTSNLLLQAGSQAGFSYVWQTAAQLTQPNWISVQTNAGGSVLTFTVPINSATQQFFRLTVR